MTLDLPVKRIQAMRDSGMLIREIAAEFGCGRAAISKRLQFDFRALDTTMMVIPPRLAELLSYIQGLGPVGSWVIPVNKHMRADLGFSRPQLSVYLERLEQCGFVECKRGAFREFRVLKRLEHPDVVQRGARPLTAEQRVWGRKAFYKARVKPDPAGQPRRRPLIAYAGVDHRERAEW